MIRFLWPLAIFLALAGVLGIGLNLDPKEVPSPLIGKPAPAFAVPSLAKPEQVLKRDDMLGKVWMLNVWASWCGACREEHPVIIDLAQRGVLPIYGLNYKDKRNDGLGWLKQLGDPYADSLFDPQGKVGLDYGVYGVPETFIVDRAGVIRYKHIGPLTPEVVAKKIEPLLEQLR